MVSRKASVIVEWVIYYRENKKRIWLLGAILLVLTSILSIGLFTKTVTAHNSSNRIKLVTSIEIEKGDTLWSIASDYISSEYDDMNDYIEEIKKSNGLYSDNIHAGNYIIIPYYTYAPY